ncbi:hypothetical protein [Micromonospora coxensis]|uniref:hypothetical protein n=1 Tax=Micromonospora coxensis TaxID=356852 RepID=UPI0015610A86|nr:hypothetical protein [Micromonospora coxensis]
MFDDGKGGMWIASGSTPCVRAGGPLNLYRAEFTTDVSVLCGGDGGSAICVGHGTFLT